MKAGWQSPETGLQVMKVGVATAELASNDPERTMQVALTELELHLIVFALYFPIQLFPELRPAYGALNQKLIELSDAQKFLEGDLDEDTTTGGLA